MLEETGISKDEMYEVLEEFLGGDATYHRGHPIASMSTIPHPLSQEIFLKIIEKSAGRLHTYKGSTEIEKEVLLMIGEKQFTDFL